jgi:hypothetical protein
VLLISRETPSNLPDPLIASMPKLKNVVRGIESQQVVNKDPTNKQLSITIDILNKLWGYFNHRSDNPDLFMLWITTSQLASLDLCRCTHLCFRDASLDCIDNLQLVKLNLKASKTDPFRNGIEMVLGIPRNQR